MLKIGKSAVAKAASFVIRIMPLVVVLALEKVGHTKLGQMIVKHLYANAAVQIPSQMIF